MIYREMVYTDGIEDKELLAAGIYKNYEYCIISYGTHPCAYINVYETPFAKLDYDEANNLCDISSSYTNKKANVHIYFTYSGKPPIESDKIHDGWWIGWDYAHSGDRFGNIIYGYSYTTKNILADIKKTILALREIK